MVRLLAALRHPGASGFSELIENSPDTRAHLAERRMAARAERNLRDFAPRNAPSFG